MSDTTKLIDRARKEWERIAEDRDGDLNLGNLFLELADALENAQLVITASQTLEAATMADWLEARKEIRDLKAALPREVTTVEALDALPDMAVVRDAQNEVYEKWRGGLGAVWRGVETEQRFTASDITLPATILFAPSVSPGGEEQG